MLRSISTEFYGDDSRWFVATVVNSTPPPQLQGRVRVRIHGIHSAYTGDVKESDLPWAQCVLPLNLGGSSAFGHVPQILPGSLVYGIFLDGKTSQIPMVLGYFNRKEFPTDVQIKASVDASLSAYRKDYSPELSLINDSLPDGNKARRRSQGVKFFIDNGYNVKHAAAIVGNLEIISTFNTYNPNNENEDRRGIAKWSILDGRWNSLVEFAGLTSSDWKLYSIQLQFVLYELRNTFQLANSKILQKESIPDIVQEFSKFYFKRNDVPDATSLAEQAYKEATR